MKRIFLAIWPRPEPQTLEEIATLQKDRRELEARIKGLQGIPETEATLYLDAARQIADDEKKRRMGAEGRATTFITAVAALFPLMTWAISSTEISTVCSPGWGCFTWTFIFCLAVTYFITAAYWALKTLAVANYHVMGVEDIVQVIDKKKYAHKALIQETLLQATCNRGTINQKLTSIQVAQKHFFNGLVVLSLLVMLNAVQRYGVLREASAFLEAWVRCPTLLASDRMRHQRVDSGLLDKPEDSGLFLQTTRDLATQQQDCP